MIMNEITLLRIAEAFERMATAQEASLEVSKASLAVQMKLAQTSQVLELALIGQDAGSPTRGH